MLLGALGFIAGGPIGGAGAGFLGELGFQLADRTVSALFDSSTTGLSERMAKLGKRSYQVTVYDFKKKYNVRKDGALKIDQ